ncbi:IS66 family insertion sequence element accessory protein TnpB [Echinicola soli]|uniref:IS66 family insertion sequence element accessory protein TnpB n=1 Tax=Echinicola soli TaxID=2591634 RepID=A0A514CGQ4_9BACT|nr:IS66 family insertion sequence element accessory protein TnpB [Echinicola soli]QDH78993.1 IS66 family insertion sequence element accessory protein TnpB [Echinicola soli]
MNLEEEMAALVEEFKTTGLTQKTFSAQKGIGYPKFNYWYRKLEGEHSREPTGFLPVRTRGSSLPAETVEVVYPNGVKLRVPGGDLSLLSNLIKLY